MLNVDGGTHVESLRNIAPQEAAGGGGEPDVGHAPHGGGDAGHCNPGALAGLVGAAPFIPGPASVRIRSVLQYDGCVLFGFGSRRCGALAFLAS